MQNIRLTSIRQGHESHLSGSGRRYRPRPSTVRCSTDSGHIAALPRTAATGRLPELL